MGARPARLAPWPCAPGGGRIPDRHRVGLAATAGDPEAALAAPRSRAGRLPSPSSRRSPTSHRSRSAPAFPLSPRTWPRRFWPGPPPHILLPAPRGTPGLGGAGASGGRDPGPAPRPARHKNRSAGHPQRHPAPAAGVASALAELPSRAGAWAELPGGPVGFEPSSILDLSWEMPVLPRAGRLGAGGLGIPLIRDGSGSRRD